jgi:DNA-binding NarL/FixJ family response regulator
MASESLATATRGAQPPSQAWPTTRAPAGGPLPSAAVPVALDVLTSRETEVLMLIAQGMSNTQISDTLCIAGETTRTHIKRILAKLGLRDRAQAVVIAYETGLVTPGG